MIQKFDNHLGIAVIFYRKSPIFRGSKVIVQTIKILNTCEGMQILSGQ